MHPSPEGQVLQPGGAFLVGGGGQCPCGVDTCAKACWGAARHWGTRASRWPDAWGSRDPGIPAFRGTRVRSCRLDRTPGLCLCTGGGRDWSRAMGGGCVHSTVFTPNPQTVRINAPSRNCSDLCVPSARPPRRQGPAGAEGCDAARKARQCPDGDRGRDVKSEVLVRDQPQARGDARVPHCGHMRAQGHSEVSPWRQWGRVHLPAWTLPLGPTVWVRRAGRAPRWSVQRPPLELLREASVMR